MKGLRCILVLSLIHIAHLQTQNAVAKNNIQIANSDFLVTIVRSDKEVLSHSDDSASLPLEENGPMKGGPADNINSPEAIVKQDNGFGSANEKANTNTVSQPLKLVNFSIITRPTASRNRFGRINLNSMPEEADVFFIKSIPGHVGESGSRLVRGDRTNVVKRSVNENATSSVETATEKTKQNLANETSTSESIFSDSDGTVRPFVNISSYGFHQNVTDDFTDDISSTLTNVTETVSNTTPEDIFENTEYQNLSPLNGSDYNNTDVEFQNNENSETTSDPILSFDVLNTDINLDEEPTTIYPNELDYSTESYGIIYETSENADEQIATEDILDVTTKDPLIEINAFSDYDNEQFMTEVPDPIIATLNVNVNDSIKITQPLNDAANSTENETLRSEEMKIEPENVTEISHLSPTENEKAAVEPTIEDDNGGESSLKPEVISSQTNSNDILLDLYKENILLKALLYNIAKVENKTKDQLSDLGIELENDIPYFDSNTTRDEESLNVVEYNSNQSTNPDPNKISNGTLTISANESMISDSNTELPEMVTNAYSDPNYHYDYDYNYEDHVNSNGQHLMNTATYSEPLPIPEGIYQPSFDSGHEGTVRKCCEADQYFNLGVQGCVDNDEPSQIEEMIKKLVIGNKETLVMKSGVLKCPNPEDPPQLAHNVSGHIYAIDRGHLYDMENQLHYNHNLYCLELIGNSIATAGLTAAFCPENNPGIALSVVRKCCPADHFYDVVESKCVLNEGGESVVSSLLREFSSDYSNDTIVEIGQLACQQGNPELADADSVYFTSSDQLCVLPTDRCYPTSLYCVEYLSMPDSYQLKPTVAYCPLDSFQKCCATNEFMHNGDCIDTGERHSPYLTQLMATLHYNIGAPIIDPVECVYLVMNDDVRWWVTNSGYLTIEVAKGIVETKDYCIEDWIEYDGDVTTGAYVCSKELKESVRLPHSMFEKGTIGKCCSPNHHLSPKELRCVPGNSEKSLQENPLVIDANITKIGYTGTPNCERYHSYSFLPEADDDYVQFGSDSNLNVISLDGSCIEKVSALDESRYCLDFGWETDDPEILTAIVCIPEWSDTKLHTEKYDLVAALLGVSCFSLLIALITLMTMRVRRGLVSTRKSKTLAGKILMSYVTAHLIGFLTLAVSMHIDVEDNTTSCLILAGTMQFFLLSGFFWNTSICSESLFLTMRVNISEKVRFVYHSLWAWGVPAIITALSLLLDIFRRKLPCGTITPKIGRVKCFFSDPDAELIYFYLPIALTLVANLVLLLTSRSARLSKLKRLEKNKPKATISNGTTKSNARNGTIKEPQNSNSSGLRTHQNRNIVSESLRLVLWSGGTWLFEVIGFITARYISPPQENWYDYLWYIPATINSLRGFGIFFILVLTTENRTKIYQTVRNITGIPNKVLPGSTYKDSRRSTAHAGNSRIMSVSVMNNSTYNDRRFNEKQRNMSIATTVTNLPVYHRQNSFDQITHPRLVHSISQMERRPSTTSSLNSLPENEDSDFEEIPVSAVNGNLNSSFSLMSNRKKSVMAAPANLPSVDEEEDSHSDVNMSTMSYTNEALNTEEPLPKEDSNVDEDLSTAPPIGEALNLCVNLPPEKEDSNKNLSTSMDVSSLNVNLSTVEPVEEVSSESTVDTF